jgi:hypothetical protein
MQETRGAVVELASYRAARGETETPTDDTEARNKAEIIDEIAHHLLMAIRAIKKLPH